MEARSVVTLLPSENRSTHTSTALPGTPLVCTRSVPCGSVVEFLRTVLKGIATVLVDSFDSFFWTVMVRSSVTAVSNCITPTS